MCIDWMLLWINEVFLQQGVIVVYLQLELNQLVGMMLFGVDVNVCEGYCMFSQIVLLLLVMCELVGVFLLIWEGFFVVYVDVSCNYVLCVELYVYDSGGSVDSVVKVY